MVGISLKVPEVLAAKVAAVARRRGVSTSALIREAIERSLNRDGADEPRSALDSARDLAGAFDGPEDLATNATYMEEFGE